MVAALSAPWPQPHNIPSYVVCLVLASVAIMLTGCGGGGGDSPTPSPSPSPGPTATVIVMRHCVRSTPSDDMDDVPGLNQYNDYSNTSWPPFSVPDYYCLPRGAQLIEAQGKWLASNGGLSAPFNMIADDCERDNVTAHSLLKGLGMAGSIVINASPFQPAATGACPQISAADLAAIVKEQLKAYPQPPSFTQLNAEMLQALGLGKAGNWTSTPCAPDATTGYLVGSCQVASQAAERFLMELGGGLQVGWGRVTPDQVTQLLELHTWYRQVLDAAPQMVAKQYASIPRDVLGALNKAEEGTKVYVGHDSDLNALNAVLGVTWDSSPFPVNVTLPGSFLRFDRAGDEVTVSYNYLEDFAEATGVMKSVPAVFAGGEKSNTVTLDQFQQLVEKNTVAACANPYVNTAKSQPTSPSLVPDVAEAHSVVV